MDGIRRRESSSSGRWSSKAMDLVLLDIVRIVVILLHGILRHPGSLLLLLTESLIGQTFDLDAALGNVHQIPRHPPAGGGYETKLQRVENVGLGPYKDMSNLPSTAPLHGHHGLQFSHHPRLDYVKTAPLVQYMRIGVALVLLQSIAVFRREEFLRRTVRQPIAVGGMRLDGYLEAGQGGADDGPAGGREGGAEEGGVGVVGCGCSCGCAGQAGQEGVVVVDGVGEAGGIGLGHEVPVEVGHGNLLRWVREE